MQERAYYLRHKTHLCVGENSVWEDRHILRSGVHVVVGTPSCVLDILQWQFVNPDLIVKYALFEADVVFSRGYKDKVYYILKLLPEKVQVKMISATIPRQALEIPRKFWDILEREKMRLVKCDKKLVKTWKIFVANFTLVYVTPLGKYLWAQIVRQITFLSL